jgi:hypothetical protein
MSPVHSAGGGQSDGRGQEVLEAPPITSDAPRTEETTSLTVQPGPEVLTVWLDGG